MVFGDFLRRLVPLIHGRLLPFLTGLPVLKYCRVTPQVAIGSQYRQAGKRALLAAGFTASVNLRQEFDTASRGLALGAHCYLPTPDHHAPTLEHLVEGVAFIRRIVDCGGRVYLHCAAGVGRAPTLGAAYLISRGMPLEDALELIRSRRSFIDLNRRQLEQLRRFERLSAT